MSASDQNISLTKGTLTALAVNSEQSEQRLHEPVNTQAQPSATLAEQTPQPTEESASELEEPMYEVHYVDQNGKEIIRYEKNPPKDEPVSQEQL